MNRKNIEQNMKNCGRTRWLIAWEDKVHTQMKWDEMQRNMMKSKWAACIEWDEVTGDAMRCNEITWDETCNKSRDYCCEAPKASLSPVGTVFVPFYKAIGVSVLKPTPPGLPGNHLYILCMDYQQNLAYSIAIFASTSQLWGYKLARYYW